MFEPLAIEQFFPYEEITVVFSVDNGNGAEVGTSKALMFVPGLAIIYDNGFATVDRVEPSKFFGGNYYEVADGYEYVIDEFWYKTDADIYDMADVLTYYSMMPADWRRVERRC